MPDSPIQGGIIQGCPIISNQFALTWLNRAPFVNSAVTLVEPDAAGVWVNNDGDGLNTDTNRTTGQWIYAPVGSMATLQKIAGAIGHATAAENTTARVLVFNFKPMVQQEGSNSGAKKVTRMVRRCLLDLTFIAGSQVVPIENGLLEVGTTGITQIRLVDTITVNADYTMKDSATGRQVYDNLPTLGNGFVEQAFDGDSSPILGFAVKPASGCGIWLAMGDLNAL